MGQIISFMMSALVDLWKHRPTGVSDEEKRRRKEDTALVFHVGFAFALVCAIFYFATNHYLGS